MVTCFSSPSRLAWAYSYGSGCKVLKSRKGEQQTPMCSAFQVSVYVMLAIVSLAKINHKASPESGHEAILIIMQEKTIFVSFPHFLRTEKRGVPSCFL